MFKKLRDEITEKVKQSPLKFQTSVQQLTQTVSPSSLSANNSTSEISLTEDEEENGEEKYDFTNDLSSASELDSSFTTVDLRSPSTPKTRRLSSSSSITSELFPIYEVPPSRYNLQSDLESCSEFDDGSSIHQFNNVSKENLYEKYRNILQKYHKYRGRFVDVQKYCQELQRELNKAKNVLTETQDKAIRRIAELKEQSSLERKAKAHLEDALRNEVEERDHIINTLNTKIELLKSGKDCDDVSHANIQSKNVPGSVSTSDAGSNELSSTSELENLKEKIKHFETLLIKSKDAITLKNTQIQELQTKVESAKKELKSSNDRNVELQNKIDQMRRKEEESLLSLAENKLNVHQELEAKESQIKSLENKIAEFDKEIKKLKNCDMEKHGAIDVSTKDDELKALKDELQQLKISRNNELTNLAEKDRLLHEFKTAVDSSNHELLKLKNEIKAANLFAKAEDMKAADLHADLKKAESTIKKLEAALSEKEKELNVFGARKESEINQLSETKAQFEGKVAELEQKLSIAKTEAIEKSSLADSLKDQVTQLNDTVQKTKSALTEKETLLKQQNVLVQRLETDLAAINVELKDNATDRKAWQETETHLKADKIVLEETVKTLRSELNARQTELRNAKNSIAEYEKTIAEKEHIAALKTQIERRLTESEAELSKSKAELERTKENEREIISQTTNLLEEINNVKLKEDQHLNQIRNLRADVNKAREETAVLEDKFKRRCDEYECLQTENENLTARLEQLEAQISKTQQLNETLSVERANLIEKIEQIRNSNVEETLKQRCEQYEHLQKEHEALKAELQQLKMDSTEVLRVNSTLGDERAKLEERIKVLQKSCDENESLLKRIENAEAERSKWEQDAVQLADIKLQNENLRKENDALKLDCQNWRVKADDLEKSVERMEKDGLKMKDQLQENVAELQLIRQQDELLRSENEKLMTNIKKLENETREQREQIERFQVKNDALKENLKTLELQRVKENEDVSFLPRASVNENLKNCPEQTTEYQSDELAQLQALTQHLQDDNNLYAVGYNEVNVFLQEVEPILQQCLRYKYLLADLRNTNRNLMSEKEEHSKNLTNLKNEIVQFTDERKKLNDEIFRLKAALESSNCLLAEQKKADSNVIVAVQKQTSNLKTEYLQFKTDLVRDLNALKQLCADCGNQVNNGGIKTIQSHLKLFSKLEDRVTTLEPLCELLKKEKFLLEDDKRQLQMRIEELQHRDGNAKCEGTDEEKNIQLVEDMYTSKIKQLMADFEMQMAQKDAEYEELRNKLFLRDDKENAAIAQETKEIVKNFHEELTWNQDAYEKLLEKYQQDTERLNNEISELKDQHSKELRESDKKWRLCLDKKIVEIEEKYKEEINELTKEWSADRKKIHSIPPVENVKNNIENQILENFAKHSEDNEALKKQVQVLTNELNSCKRSQWKDIDLELMNAYGNSNNSQVSIEDCTEMEYLRNILFEYMMGHQPLVLARVLAAVVKFDNNQTKLILQKEEQKLSLLGQLGLT